LDLHMQSATSRAKLVCKEYKVNSSVMTSQYYFMKDEFSAPNLNSFPKFSITVWLFEV
jgi:hypothetical protein